jgi:hypothetical protein
MNSRERELVEEWQEEILKLCTQAVIGKTIRTPDGLILLEATVPTFEDYVRVQENMAQRGIDLLTSEGIWMGVSVYPLDDVPVPVAA